MFAYIKGIVEEKQDNKIVLDVSGVGFELFASLSTLNECAAVGQCEKLFTQMVVKEDEISLIGFKTELEKKLFLALTSVSGVGTKSALQVLSAMDYNQVILAISSENPDVLVKNKACGKKTAERLVLELKGKFDGVVLDKPNFATNQKTNPIVDEASNVLINLGLTKKEAQDFALKFYDSSIEDAGQLVSKVLKGM